MDRVRRAEPNRRALTVIAVAIACAPGGAPRPRDTGTRRAQLGSGPRDGAGVDPRS